GRVFCRSVTTAIASKCWLACLRASSCLAKEEEEEPFAIETLLLCCLRPGLSASPTRCFPTAHPRVFKAEPCHTCKHGDARCPLACFVGDKDALGDEQNLLLTHSLKR